MRGKIVPIVDLRIQVPNLGKVEYDEFTARLIILNLAARIVGIVVDGVSGDDGSKRRAILREVPSLVTSIDTKYIAGLATVRTAHADFGGYRKTHE